MSTKVNVQSCSLRRDGQYLITYRVGASIYSALSAQPIPAGTDVRVHDGKVVG